MSKVGLRAARTALRPTATLQTQTQRAFISLPGSEPQSFTATRILPYRSSSLYTLIADVDSYSSFVPYCLESKVTKWSSPDKDGNSWPSEADLKVGWGGYEESFTSRLFCVPGSIVEALGGEATTSLSKSELSHHSASFDAPATANSIFQSLNTRWTIKPFHYKPLSGQSQTTDGGYPTIEQTEVNLALNFQFSNVIYAALSKTVAPRIAGIMIEAFEVRARRLLDVPGATVPGGRKDTLGHGPCTDKKIMV